MNSYFVISSLSRGRDAGPVTIAAANLFGGGPAARQARPADARLVRRGDSLALAVTNRAHWEEIYAAIDGEYLFFTTAPGALLSRWFGPSGELRLDGRGLQICLRRPLAHNEPDCYPKFGPFWRRFLIGVREVHPVRGAQSIVEPQDLAAEDGWPVYCNPLPVTNHPGLPALLERGEEFRHDPLGFLVPPWVVEQPSYWSWKGAQATGLGVRNRLRKVIGRTYPAIGEPLAITLWRAADDLALRPEMAAGAEIEVGGIPRVPGIEGPGTFAVLRLAPYPADDLLTSFRRQALFLREPHPGLLETLRTAFRSDLSEAFGGPDSLCTWEQSAEDDACPPTLRPVLPKHERETPEAPIFTIVERIETADREAGGPVLTGFADHFLTNGGKFENPAVNRFIAEYWRPTSRQTNTDSVEFWRSVLLFQDGAGLGLHELSQGTTRPLATRPRRAGDSFYPCVEDSSPPRVLVAQEPGHPLDETVVRIALVMPPSTILRVGSTAQLDDRLSKLDGGALLI